SLCLVVEGVKRRGLISTGRALLLLCYSHLRNALGCHLPVSRYTRCQHESSIPLASSSPKQESARCYYGSQCIQSRLKVTSAPIANKDEPRKNTSTK
ncbi:unnamed protein product, partial [Ectocarpus sp. 12 AP-2014]